MTDIILIILFISFCYIMILNVFSMLGTKRKIYNINKFKKKYSEELKKRGNDVSYKKDVINSKQIREKILKVSYNQDDTFLKKLNHKYDFLYPSITTKKKYSYLFFVLTLCFLVLYLSDFEIIESLILSIIITVISFITYINIRYNKKISIFLDNFVYAIDTIHRGVKAGIMLNDCFQTIVDESHPYIVEQFEAILWDMRVGMSFGKVMDRFASRMPVKEVRFFCIALTIQSEMGGNLSDILDNLSSVLRKRKSIIQKIAILSQEAKTGSIILMSLPLVVVGLVCLVSPDYMDPLFNTSVGNIVFYGGILWMFLGGLIMRKMINFYR